MRARSWFSASLLLLACLQHGAPRRGEHSLEAPVALPALATPEPSALHPQAASRSRGIPAGHGNPEGSEGSSGPVIGRLNWHALAVCESTDNPRTDTGNGYYGLYQFDLTTWRSVGGSGNPAHASRAEQTYRAQLLFAERGRQPWPRCGRRL